MDYCVVYGVHGVLTPYSRARRVDPYITEEGDLIGRIDDEPSIPVDSWDEYSSRRDEIQALPKTVKISSPPITCIWDPSFDNLFQESITQLEGCTSLPGDKCTFGLFGKKVWAHFKESSISTIQKAVKDGSRGLDSVSVGVALFGKEPALIACWKLLKAF